MPISLGLGITVPSGVNYYRITSLAFRTKTSKYHSKVVNGEGAVRSRHGARYNYPGARTVYLADTPGTCFAERMFYFHREVLPASTASVAPDLAGLFVGGSIRRCVCPRRRDRQMEPAPKREWIGTS